jgi:hypothetical protein
MLLMQLIDAFVGFKIMRNLFWATIIDFLNFSEMPHVKFISHFSLYDITVVKRVDHECFHIIFI